MADDDDRELTEEEVAEEERKAKRKQRTLLIVMAALLVALSVALTLTLLYFLGAQDTEVPDEDTVMEEPLEPASREAIYFPIRDKFVVNYNVRGRQRFLQAEVNLMFRDNEVAEAIEEHMPRIRNDLIMLFSGQEFADLQTPEGRELLRQDALRQVQDILEEETGEPGIEQVLFTSFVMQ